MFDREKVRLVASAIEAALAEVSKTHGVLIGRSGARFDSEGFTTKLTVTEAVTHQGKEVKSPYEAAFIKNAALMGMKPSDLGKKFTSGRTGSIYTIVGMKESSRKYPILGRGPEGGMYKFEAAVVAANLL